MERPGVEVLDYAEPPREVGAPLRAIVGAAVAYGAGHWLAALVSDWWYFVGSRNSPMGYEKLGFNMMAETVAIGFATAVVLCVQWGAWWVWRAPRGGVWLLAAGAGVAHCGMAWGLQWAWPSRSLWAAVWAFPAPAVGIGIVLAWWRGR